MVWSTTAIQFVALLPLTAVVLHITRWILPSRIKKRGYLLPPGPTPLPFFGSALSVNAQRMWLTFTEWRAKYGDMIYVRLFDTDVVVLNSTSVATELLDKRSQIYSDRPAITTVLAPHYDFNFAFARYGEHWRLCRRIFQETFHAEAALRFRPMQLRSARQLIVNMIGYPDEYPSHFSTFSAAFGLSAVYDYESSARNDPMVSIIDTFLRVAVQELSPEKALIVKIFPFLMHIPEWLPGSWITRGMKKAYACRNEMVETPYQYARERMESRDHINVSMMSDSVAQMEKSDISVQARSEYETAVKHACATALNASADTTSAILMTFTLAMVENPHIWKRAQADMDAVVGTDRLPEFGDRLALPYIDAIIREAFRWRPPLPLGGPHAVMQSDIYEGYYIPKGATILINAWAMSRDPVRYPDGDKFKPERFLDAEGMLTDDDSEFVFGYGRRRCPGRSAADASVWSAIATMLATLDFDLAKDADENDVTFEATFVSGVTEHPNPFPCRLTPRSHVGELLDRALAT